MKKILLLAAFLSNNAMSTTPYQPHVSMPAFDHEDVYKDVMEFINEETSIDAIDNQLDICIWEIDEWECERYDEHTTSAFVSQIYMAKGRRNIGKAKKKKGRSGIKAALSKIPGISTVKGKIKFDSLKLDDDGNLEIKGFEGGFRLEKLKK